MHSTKAHISILFLSALLFATTSYSQYPSHTPLTKPEQDSIKKEIQAMLATDQKYRWMISFGETDMAKVYAMRQLDYNTQLELMSNVKRNRIGISQRAKDSLMAVQAEIDSVNFLRLAAIIKAHGFPAEYVRASDVTTLLLHGPRTMLTDSFMQVLFQEVKYNYMPGMEYAILYDRLQMERKQPELYFVSEHYDPETNKSSYGTPTDIDATNKARAEIGLRKFKAK